MKDGEKSFDVSGRGDYSRGLLDMIHEQTKILSLMRRNFVCEQQFFLFELSDETFFM